METKEIAKIFEVAEEFRPLGKPIMSGVDSFDKASDGGIRGGELVVLTGSQKQGKTSYALWLTKRIVDSGVPCLWFTYEMNPWYLKEKLQALGAKEEFATYVPFKQDDKSIDFIEQRILEAQESHACKIIFIDHLHRLVSYEQELTGNTSWVVGAVAKRLKDLAVRTDSIIFLIAHSKRLAEGERVDVNSIRDSALVANEADYVYTIERLKKKEKKIKSLEEIMDGNQTDYSKVCLVANRRTGGCPIKLFQVTNGIFTELTQGQVESIKDSVQI